jgi:hypothetical protein
MILFILYLRTSRESLIHIFDRHTISSALDKRDMMRVSHCTVSLL